MIKNYFQGTKKHPFHISIGTVVINKKNRICCHYFDKLQDMYTGILLNDFYILMRETMEINETIENALFRGLREEFSLKAKLNTYIGSIVSSYIINDIKIEKTTLYFLCNFISFQGNRDLKDRESNSFIKWLDINELIKKMQKQKKRLQRTDNDESKILIRVKKYLGL